MKKHHHYTLLICLIIVLQACSLKYVYNQLDWLVVTYIEDYVSLDDDQSELLSKKFQKTLNWHRDSQLKLYADWLQKFRNDVDTDINTKTVLTHFDIMKSFFVNITVRFSEDIYVLLPSLSEDQTIEILGNLSDKNSEFAEEYLHEDKQELLTQQQENVVEQYQDWLGDLSKQQITLISTAVAKTDFVYPERYLIRLKWQKALSTLLYQAKAGKDVKQEFKNLFLKYEKFRDAATRKKFDNSKIASAELIVVISKTLTKEQKQHLFQKIEDYKSLFLELML